MYMIERTCPNCNKTYLADPSRLKFGRQTTCSRQCSYELRGKEKQNHDTHTCQICGILFERKPFQSRAKIVTVCSMECYKKARIKKLVTPKPPLKSSTEFDCEQCGNHVVISATLKGARRFRFCSADCANTWNSGASNSAWRGGYAPYYGSNWKRQRRAARKRDNYTCQDCGVTEHEHGKQLDVHHIIRFADFEIPEQANHLSNLVSLCHVCHMVREWRDYPGVR
jgi:hypothetical protein